MITAKYQVKGHKPQGLNLDTIDNAIQWARGFIKYFVCCKLTIYQDGKIVFKHSTL